MVPQPGNIIPQPGNIIPQPETPLKKCSFVFLAIACLHSFPFAYIV
jgi:hypothetical protein